MSDLLSREQFAARIRRGNGYLKAITEAKQGAALTEAQIDAMYADYLAESGWVPPASDGPRGLLQQLPPRQLAKRSAAAATAAFLRGRQRGQ